MTSGLYRSNDNVNILPTDISETTSRRRSSGSRPRSQEPFAMAKSDMSAADYFKLLNVETAKAISIFLVVGFALYHGMLHLTYGVTPCKGLFLDGVYKEGGDGLWQPWGCMMHKYTYTDTVRCFRYNGFYGKANHFVFVGDSRLRQIYLAFKSFLETEDFQDSNFADAEFKAHHDLTWTAGHINLKLDFVWVPVINDSMFQAMNQWSKSENYPSVFVLGCATHTIKGSNNSEVGLYDYTRNLTVLRPILENISLKGKSKVLWLLQPNVNVEKLHPLRSAITNEAISKYNLAASDVLSSSPESKIVLWNSLSRLLGAAIDQMEDGLHLPSVVLKQAVLMLINQHCNEKMNFNDGSCCKSSDQPTSLQIITFALFAICGIILLFKWSMQKLTGLQQASLAHAKVKPKSSITESETSLLPKTEPVKTIDESDNVDQLLFSLVKMGLILAYFYTCDRTNFFMKENKYFTHLNFWLPVLYVLILGLFFHEDTKQSTLLHRQQSDEWKGWMQLVILVYHMTGGSKSLPIYMLIRVLVSSYIFLNGYGHFSYSWKEQKESDDIQSNIIRFFTVIFRMNFFAVLLCLSMNRPYQFYYFVPLVSFWYAVQYVTHLLPPQINAKSSENQPIQYLYFILKLVVLSSIISVLYMSEVFFEKVFVTRPWKALFVTIDDDIRAWWFRWKIDRYSSVFGVLFGFICALASRYRLMDDSDSSKGLLWSTSANILAILVSIIGVGGYTLFAALCSFKADCTEVHPYIVFVPIISFIILRNVSVWFRSRYSSFFSWFGRISLELFLAQYHIWLAADSHGVLVLIPNYPVMNILLTSFIFICASHEIHKITEIVLPFMAPKNSRAILRNVAIFIAILIPIGIHDGMF